MTVRSVAAAVAVAAICAWSLAGLPAVAEEPSGAAALPPAIVADPLADPDYPPTGISMQFRSHGALLNGLVYRPSGNGPHPTVVMFHGLPGNETNMDLAQVLSRAGWTVVTFHYTGSWGSGGRFTLRNGVDDAAALLRHMRQPDIAQAWGVDPDHVLLIGHSYGGYVAARAAAEQPGVIGLVLMAPWDISFDTRQWGPLPPAERKRTAAASFDDVDGRLTGADHVSLTAEVMKYGPALDLAKIAPSLTRIPVLLITVTHDDEDDKAADFLARMQHLDAPKFTSQLMDTDHSFDSQRIGLEAAILRWMASLPAT
ncbi:MAG TPA: alpha/beta fold hydrolase [Steroidobacteraceae bacterium]|jgi:pimeloyl-ACP methyl ester carboxylesterase